MSMTETFAASIPPHCIAIGALRRLAAANFLAWHKRDDSDARARWICLNETAIRLGSRCALRLSLSEAAALRDALIECEPGPDVDYLFAQTFEEGR